MGAHQTSIQPELVINAPGDGTDQADRIQAQIDASTARRIRFPFVAGLTRTVYGVGAAKTLKFKPGTTVYSDAAGARDPANPSVNLSPVQIAGLGGGTADIVSIRGADGAGNGIAQEGIVIENLTILDELGRQADSPGTRNGLTIQVVNRWTVRDVAILYCNFGLVALKWDAAGTNQDNAGWKVDKPNIQFCNVGAYMDAFIGKWDGGWVASCKRGVWTTSMTTKTTASVTFDGTGAAASVQVGDTVGFPSVGYFTLGGDTIHYTGKTATTLTGLTGGTAGATRASASRVAGKQSDNTTNPPAGALTISGTKFDIRDPANPDYGAAWAPGIGIHVDKAAPNINDVTCESQPTTITGGVPTLRATTGILVDGDTANTRCNITNYQGRNLWRSLDVNVARFTRITNTWERSDSTDSLLDCYVRIANVLDCTLIGMRSDTVAAANTLDITNAQNKVLVMGYWGPVRYGASLANTLTGDGGSMLFINGVLNGRAPSVTGTPEGVVAAAIGTTCTRLDGGAGTTFYVKESGAGTNTGWVAK